MAKGIQYGTLGELWQGPYRGEDGSLQIALVTLPCERYRSEVTVERRSGKSAPPPKSAEALSRFLEYFDIKENLSDYSWSVKSNIPHAIGMASSTADILATIYALASLHAIQLRDDHIRDILRGIERSDPVYCSTAGLYLSKSQQFVCSWNWRPKFQVIYTVLPGTLKTEDVDESQLLGFYEEHYGAYQESFARMEEGFAFGDNQLIGAASTECGRIAQAFSPLDLFDQFSGIGEKIGAAGVVRAYTGTILGLLFDHKDDSCAGRFSEIRALLDRHGLPAFMDKAGYEDL